jgi:hypothetical protein
LTDRDSPKAQLRVTLETARDHVNALGIPAELRIAQIRGLIDHALALSLRVGEMAKPRKEPAAMEISQ